MTHVRKANSWMTMLVVLAMVITLMAVPGPVGAADHLDAPGLASPGGDARLDINDLLVFEAENPDNTVLVMTVNPAAAGDASFASAKDGSYHFRIDNTGDGIEDITYSVTFKDKPNGQKIKVRKATRHRAQQARPRGRVIARGRVGETLGARRGGTVLAELRSDPFFFDLAGFLTTVEGQAGGPGLGEMPTDFFEELNTLAIVLEVPDSELGGNIGVWATTSVRNSRSAERSHGSSCY